MHRIISASLARCRGRCRLALVLALAASLAIAVGLSQLLAGTQGLQVTRAWVGTVPVTLYRPSGLVSAPVVVIAHGFAGSQTLMQPQAVTLARNGYIAVTFDFAGHGRNANPFVSSLMDRDKRLQVLLAGLEPAIALGMAEPGADGRLALVGHSMAGDVLAHHAQAHPGSVSAMVLLSPYLSEQVVTESLSNLLLIYGALEPGMLHEQGFKILAEAGEGAAEEGVTQGAPADGRARRLILADGVEHIGVLYSREGLAETLAWLDQTFGRTGEGYLDQRGPWLGLLYLGLVVLAWPLSLLLPRLSTRPLGAGLCWRRLWPVALAPAVLTPLILWKLPSDFLPILVGDYLALHFALYGAITALGLWIMKSGVWSGSPKATRPAEPRAFGWRGFILATLAATAYGTLAIGLTTDRFVTTLLPGPERIGVVIAMLIGTLVYFSADEWATRGEGAARGGHALTKLLFLLSLLLAVGLNLNELFFLIIIVPAILIFFLVYGLIGGWIYRRVGHPMVGAIANAVVFAIATAVTFPLVGA
ncbi:alpha/beta hydrolase [Thiocystis violacea]|uniref:alpha/beta hydrolase n=1 Tax=Thiocystis violacea TaxID=13725 RepID=UPI001907913A|nr:alpha/beta fold hydrolase [Thiocystis violacea]MBK1719103.1 alpha/beta hydrolase [Thiocystis violacea]